MTNIEAAKLIWHDTSGPTSEVYGDVYFSVDDGAAESDYVFLQHNQLAQRFSELKDSPETLFTIVETGFGTGLNFTLCLKLWQASGLKKARLKYISIEKHPLRLMDLKRAARQWPELSATAEQWLVCYPPIFPGMYTCPIRNNIQLCLFFGDIDEGLAELKESLHPQHQQRSAFIDAWFLDGFAPSKNPEMWRPSLFKAMADLSHNESTFATFTAAGLVKRGLRDAGFAVEKVPGFGRKREMLKGKFSGHGSHSVADCAPKVSNHNATWYLNPPTATIRSVAVIGAGIAGAHIANALARRGLAVTVFEEGPEPALKASGNAQGIVYCKISHRDSHQSRFICHALNFAQHFYRHQFADGVLNETSDGGLCGVLHLENEETLEKIADTFNTSEHFLVCLNREQASATSGVEVSKGAVFVKSGLWLNPPALCHALLDHPNITCHFATPINELNTTDGRINFNDQWFDHVVMACGVEKLPQCHFLPIKPIRGQVTNIDSKSPLDKLQSVICDLGYVAPQRHNQHCIGASFNLDESDLALTYTDQLQNIDHLKQALPTLEKVDITPNDLTGRTGMRCTTPDYLPIVGPLCQPERFKEQFAALSKNAKQDIYQQPFYQNNLSVFTGFGSKGLAYAPLCAEQLATQILGERPALPLSQITMLHPSRFLVRDIIRNKL